MYLTIIILPLLGSIVAGFLGRKVGVQGAQIITCSSVLVTTFLALLAWVEVAFNNIPVTIYLFRWIDSEWLNISWGFYFDALTVTMLIPVLIISSLVHIYSIGYMSADPHQQRFFSYLSLFTFMMIILVTGNNYLLMFVGWEGKLTDCLKWLSFSELCEWNLMAIISVQKRSFFSMKLKSIERIGPHNLNIISLIIGSLLTGSYLEKRSQGLGVRIVFVKHSNNVEYLMWFHSMLVKAGYSSNNKPQLYKLIGKGNKVLFFYCFKSYSFSSFIWLFNMFYRGNLKIIPRNLYEYFTPLVLATIFLSSLGKGEKAILGKKYILDRSLLSVNDLKYLSFVLKKKYNIESSIEFNNSSRFREVSGSLYIKNISAFSKIVKPHLLYSQYNLLNKSTIKLNIFGSCRTQFSSIREFSATP